MSYDLRAFAGLSAAMAQAAGKAGAVMVELPQGYGLLPITPVVHDRLDAGMGKPFGDVFWFLSPGVEALGREVSRIGSVAYLEAQMFGGTGTQAAVVWRAGEVWLGPVTTKFGWPRPDRSASAQWAFNQALRALGVDRGGAFDEFEALDLGRHRHTEDWQSG